MWEGMVSLLRFWVVKASGFSKLQLSLSYFRDLVFTHINKQCLLKTELNP